MSRNFSFAIGEYYHIYNRGVDKRIIFEDIDDRNRFMMLLYLCNGDKPVDIAKLFEEGKGSTFSDVLSLDRGQELVAIGAYVLMPNHFHILIKEEKENGISKFMSKLSTGYTMYFNSKRSRSGSLFEGRFRARHIENDQYLKYLFAYIHLNPIKLTDPAWKENGIKDREKAESFLHNYSYSSYFDFMGSSRPQKSLLALVSFPSYFSSIGSFSSFINDWLFYKDLYDGKG